LLLEQYLQSLIAAPIKNNIEVCKFLSTDLIKEKDKRASVSQPGYKEGYLTKRGKNFGGFVASFKEHLKLLILTLA
jgi:RalA-binding protein 1